MAASTTALNDLIRSVEVGRSVKLDSIYLAHNILMSDDPYEQAYAGRRRDMQNWIGGSDHHRGTRSTSPLRQGWSRSTSTIWSPLPTARISVSSLKPRLLSRRVGQPFTDGNGRIGRALIKTILRKRGAQRRVAIPLASAIVAGRDDYFEALRPTVPGTRGR